MSTHSIANKKKPLLSGSRRATVIRTLPSGEIAVRLGVASSALVVCDFLATTKAEPPLLLPGDKVLVLYSDEPGEKPVVVGKISDYRAPDGKRLVLEAGEELTIRCGEATIAIRKSGKILIKGVDIVSHARQSNRIRGGSVQMN